MTKAQQTLRELNLILRRHRLLEYLGCDSITQLEEVTGVSRFTIHKFLNGKRLHPQTIQKLLNAGPRNATEAEMLKRVRKCEVIIK